MTIGAGIFSEAFRKDILGGKKSDQRCLAGRLKKYPGDVEVLKDLRTK